MNNLLRHLCVAAIALLALGAGTLVVRTGSAQTQQVQPGQVIISELRYRGPNGSRDEFIELYNNTDSPITVQASDTSAGWAISTSGTINQTVVRGNVCTIPSGTVIPARGHLLCANTDVEFESGYSLNSYPSGNPTPSVPAAAAVVPSTGTFAQTTPDRVFLVDDLPDGFGVALFTSGNIPNQTTATRLDAFGFTSSPALYKEGSGFPTVPSTSNEHTLYRDLRTGLPQDTNNNSADFRFVATTGSIQTQLNGAPGPENLRSPIVTNAINGTQLDPAVSATSSPNRVRDTTAETNAPLGTLLLRRTFTNNTGQPVSRLRFRVVNITTRGTPASECGGSPCADVRALSSDDTTATLSNTTVVQVRGVTLEATTTDTPDYGPVTPEGGGLNSSLSANFITLQTPLAAGASVNIQFKLGIVTSGPYRFFLNIEALNSPAPVITIN